jgi:hypothetical protein
MDDSMAHLVTSGIGLVASVIALYVSYRMAMMREWFRKEMQKVVTENCAGKDKFDAHVESDKVFQNTITEKWEQSERVGDLLLESKFETVKTQVAAVGDRVNSLTRLVEQRLR